MTLLQKITQVRSLSRAINAAKKILTERGEANSASMANDILSQYRLLNEEQKISFYHALATKFNPDPSLVLKVAQDYANDPTGKNWIGVRDAVREFSRVSGVPFKNVGGKWVIFKTDHNLQIKPKNE